MNTKRIISLILSVITACLCLASCTNGNNRKVMSVGDFDVTYEVYRYVAVNSRWDVEAEYGDDVWDSDKADEAKEKLTNNVREHLATLYTVCSLGADHGLSWNDSSIASAVKIERNQLVDEFGGEEEFAAGLEEAAMTEGAFEFIKSNELLIDEVYLKIAYEDERNSDEEYLNELFLSDKFIRIKQILIGGENAGTDEQNLEVAQGVMDKINSGEDFDVLCREYNNDLYMFNNDAGYYITKGLRDAAFEDAAFALEVGEVSEIIKTDAGYSIIKRYEKDEEYISENFNALTDEYFESLYTAAFEERFDKILSEMPELPDDIDLLEIK